MTGHRVVKKLHGLPLVVALLGCATRPATTVQTAPPGAPGANGWARRPDATDGPSPARLEGTPVLQAPSASDLEALRPLLARGPAFLVRDADSGPNARITLIGRTEASADTLRGVITHPDNYDDFMPILNSVEMISSHGNRQAFRFHVAAPVFDVTALCNLHAISDRRVDIAITQSETGPGGSRWDFNPDPAGGTQYSLTTWGDPSQGHWMLRQVARRSPSAIAGMNIAVDSVLALGAVRRAEILSGRQLPIRPADGVAPTGVLAPPPEGPWLWLSREQSVATMKLTTEGAIEQVTVAAHTQAAPALVLRRLTEVEHYRRIWGSFREVTVLPRAADDPEGAVRFSSRIETALTRLEGEQRMRVAGNTVWHDGLTGDFANGGHRWDVVPDPMGGSVVLLTGGSDLNRAGWVTRALMGLDPWLAAGFAGSWKIVWLRNFLRSV